MIHMDVLHREITILTARLDKVRSDSEHLARELRAWQESAKPQGQLGEDGQTEMFANLDPFGPDLARDSD